MEVKLFHLWFVQVNSRFIIPFGGPAVTENVAEKNVHPKDTEKSLINELIANSNQSNRHKSTLNDTKLNSDENKVVCFVFSHFYFMLNLNRFLVHVVSI